MSESGTEIPYEGVTPLDHTADVGIEVEAPDLPELFRRAALGLTHLILEAPPPDGTDRRTLRASGDDAPGLLRNWLRELLYLHEVEGLAYVGADFPHIDEGELEAALLCGRSSRPPAREIKGVTLHGLVAERSGGGWSARVIFDV